MKFLIWGPGRTGSILYSNLINSYINKQTGVIDNIRFIQLDETPVWDKPIVHTHRVELVKDAPNEYSRIVTTRSLLDTTLSVLVAEHVDHYTISNASDEIEYINRYKDYKFCIDEKKFFHRLYADNKNYKNVFSYLDNNHINYIKLDYEVHSNNYDRFYSQVDLVWEYNSNDILINRKMPVNKFDMVLNLSELVELYTNIKKQFDIYDFSDNITIDNIRSLSSAG